MVNFSQEWIFLYQNIYRWFLNIQFHPYKIVLQRKNYTSNSIKIFKMVTRPFWPLFPVPLHHTPVPNKFRQDVIEVRLGDVSSSTLSKTFNKRISIEIARSSLCTCNIFNEKGGLIYMLLHSKLITSQEENPFKLIS